MHVLMIMAAPKYNPQHKIHCTIYTLEKCALFKPGIEGQCGSVPFFPTR